MPPSEISAVTLDAGWETSLVGITGKSTESERTGNDPWSTAMQQDALALSIQQLSSEEKQWKESDS
jgi:hypothetical protein